MDKYQLTEMGEYQITGRRWKGPIPDGMILNYLLIKGWTSELEEELRTNDEWRGYFRRLFEAGYIEKVD